VKTTSQMTGRPGARLGSDTLSCASRSQQGFSLLELLVAMAVFLLVAAAAFSLYNKHLAVVSQQQDLSGLNMGIRNALSELELDLGSAGQNMFSGWQQLGAPPAPFSLGVIIRNNTPAVAGNCTPNVGGTWVYPTTRACFDSLTIIYAKAPGCPVLSLANTQSLFTGAMLGNDSGASLAADAACFQSGDEIAVIQPAAGTCDNGAFVYCMGVTTLSANGAVVGTQIQLTTNAPGAAHDPLGIIFDPGGQPNYFNGKGVTAAVNYAAAQTYIVDLGTGGNDITYSVRQNPVNDTDDQLIRCTGVTCTVANEQVLTDQVIGFKVGAALWNNKQANATDEANYFYDGTKYCTDTLGGGVTADCTVTPPPANDKYDFTLIRAVRISMIGRTTPRFDLEVFPKFQNGFDNGPYLVQQGAMAVDLRNISDSDILN
jgi:prepilin-type N-terminal cleavage/methylation domain-containing protein